MANLCFDEPSVGETEQTLPPHLIERPPRVRAPPIPFLRPLKKPKNVTGSKIPPPPVKKYDPVFEYDLKGQFREYITLVKTTDIPKHPPMTQSEIENLESRVLFSPPPRMENPTTPPPAPRAPRIEPTDRSTDEVSVIDLTGPPDTPVIIDLTGIPDTPDSTEPPESPVRVIDLGPNTSPKSVVEIGGTMVTREELLSNDFSDIFN